MIAEFLIQVPSVIETEGDFEVTVFALDAQGKVLVDDSTTVVQIIPSDTNIVFDGNGDGNYGQPGDDSKQLTNGVAIFPARDTKASEFTITVTDTSLNTGNKVFPFSFNCLIIPSKLTIPPEGTTTEGAYRFFDPRDTIPMDEEDRSLYEERQAQVEQFSEGTTLTARLLEGLSFEANDIGQGNGSAIITFPNDLGTIAATQPSAISRATYNTNAIQGSSVATFDGSDFYDLENPTTPIIPPTSDFTVILAARLLQTGGTQTVLAQYLNASNNGSLLVRYEGGWELAITSDGSEPALSVKSGAGTHNQATFVVFTRSGNTFTVEVDGTLIDSHTDTGPRTILQTGNLLGARGADALAYNVSPSEFYPSDLLWTKVYASALTSDQKLLEFYAYQDQYTDPASFGTSYLSYLNTTYDFDLLYGLDETVSNPLVRDYSGNGFNARYEGDPTRGVTALVTDGGTAYRFDPDESLDIPDFSAAGTSHTFHFWVSSTEAIGAQDRYLFDHESSRLSLFWETNEGGLSAGNIGFFDSSYKDFGVALPRDGQSYLVSFVFSGASAELYLNGVSQGTVAYSARSLSASSTKIRNEFADTTGRSGVITIDVIAYKNALQNSTQILDVYNQGIV